MGMSKTKLLIGAAALAAGASGPAMAQSSVSLYGLVDAWVGSIKAPGEQRAWVQQSGGMSTSFWGMSGTEDLGGGTKAIFKMEAFFQPNSGAAGRFPGDTFFARNAYVGLQNDTYGTLKMGRVTTQYFLSTILFNPFGDSYVFSPMVYHVFLGEAGQGVLGDSGWSNSVQYTTPDFAGFQASGVYSFSNVAGEGGQNKWSLGANYFHGPLSATVTYQQIKYDSVVGDLSALGYSSQRAVLVGAAYDFQFLKLFGQYQHIQNNIVTGNINVNTGQLGVSVPLAGGKVLASYAYSKSNGASDVSRNTWAVGYDYSLSKRTDVYVAYLNDKISGLSAGNTFGTGIRLRF